MSEGLDYELVLENAEEVKQILREFPDRLKTGLQSRLEYIAQKKEKELKSMGGWTDRTGHFRRSLFVSPMFDELGIEFGSFARYGYWVGRPHGTWMPSWWEEWINRCVIQFKEELENAINDVVEEFNKESTT